MRDACWIARESGERNGWLEDTAGVAWISNLRRNVFGNWIYAGSVGCNLIWLGVSTHYKRPTPEVDRTSWLFWKRDFRNRQRQSSKQNTNLFIYFVENTSSQPQALNATLPTDVLHLHHAQFPSAKTNIILIEQLSSISMKWNVSNFILI